MFKSKKSTVSISIARGAFKSIFDECDRYDIDETGGRIIGIYRQKGDEYNIQVLGVLEPGPNARRSPTSFFQDGEYQEEIFRMIEESHPNIEHLGNWHTHHVNGYPTLSEGDKSTYFKVVNHEQHNTDFFYALLVVHKNSGGNQRYEVKHYFFRSNDDRVYEIPSTQVQIVDVPTLWPRSTESTTRLPSGSSPQSSQQRPPNLERVKDQELFSEFYPNLRALYSKSIGTLYWKGSLALSDDSHVDVLVMENVGDGAPYYSIIASGENSILADISADYNAIRFRSARHAVLHLEKVLNQTVYRRKKDIVPISKGDPDQNRVHETHPTNAPESSEHGGIELEGKG